jgi:hypothetical protein
MNLCSASVDEADRRRLESITIQPVMVTKLWKRQQCEEHPNGFSSEVYATLRENIFPSPKIERDDKVCIYICTAS